MMWAVGGTWVHRLSEINPDTKRGVCAACGPVKLKYRRQSDSWRCYPSWDHGPYHRANGAVRLGDFMAALELQGHACAICRAPIDEKAHADHDHATGLFRGALCRGCNGALGFMEDDPGRLEAAAAYLRRF